MIWRSLFRVICTITTTHRSAFAVRGVHKHRDNRRQQTLMRSDRLQATGFAEKKLPKSNEGILDDQLF
jgi:hypothetical protein